MGEQRVWKINATRLLGKSKWGRRGLLEVWYIYVIVMRHLHMIQSLWTQLHTTSIRTRLHTSIEIASYLTFPIQHISLIFVAEQNLHCITNEMYPCKSYQHQSTLIGTGQHQYGWALPMSTLLAPVDYRMFPQCIL